MIARALHWFSEPKYTTPPLVLYRIKMSQADRISHCKSMDSTGWWCWSWISRARLWTGISAEDNPLRRNMTSSGARSHRISILGPTVSCVIDHDYHLICNSILHEGMWFGLRKGTLWDAVLNRGLNHVYVSSRAHRHKTSLSVMIWVGYIFSPGTEPFDILLQHTISQKSSIRILVVKAY